MPVTSSADASFPFLRSSSVIQDGGGDSPERCKESNIVPSRLGSIGSYDWIMSTYLPLQAIHIHFTNALCGEQTILDVENVVDRISKNFGGNMMQLLVKEVVLTEVLKNKFSAGPLSKTTSTASLHSLQGQCLFNFELLVVGLLEALSFYPSEISDLGVHAVDLLDYCTRKIRQIPRLSSELGEAHKEVLRFVREVDSVNELLEVYDEIAVSSSELKVCMCAVHVCRYLVEHRAMCPLSLSAGLFRNHDMIIEFANLIDAAPWSRINPATGMKEKWDGEWKQYTGEVVMVEGNCWIALLSLVSSDEVRSGAYELTSFRVRSLIKLRGLLTELLLRQIPHLDILKRFIEEMHVGQSIGTGASLIRPQAGAVSSLSPFAIVEVGETLFDKYSSEESLLTTIPLTPEQVIEISTKLAERLESMIPSAQDEKSVFLCSVCLKPGEHRCSGCRSVVYCGRDCQVKDWTSHKKDCN